MKIETQNIYNSERPDNYVQVQTERSLIKLFSTKPESFYSPVAAELTSLSNVNSRDWEDTSMICMGTRNNAERNHFRDLMGLESVFSLDIADGAAAPALQSDQLLSDRYQEYLDEPQVRSGSPDEVKSREQFIKYYISLFETDFVMDFTSLPESWSDKWDLLYSNSLDHSYDPTATFREWVRVVKTGGYLALGVSLEEEVSPTDPAAFKKQDILKFLSAEANVRFLSSVQEGGFETFIIEKIGM